MMLWRWFTWWNVDLLTKTDGIIKAEQCSREPGLSENVNARFCLGNSIDKL